MEFTHILIFTLAAIIIVALGTYAGRLLFLLKAQKQRHEAAKTKRIKNIESSVQTIAFAMLQQQCDLSEGVIRICRMLEGVPLDPIPDYKARYPATFELFEKVKNYPTHDERARLPKKERREQDKERGEFESELESKILKESESLKGFCVSS